MSLPFEAPAFLHHEKTYLTNNENNELSRFQSIDRITKPIRILSPVNKFLINLIT